MVSFAGQVKGTNNKVYIKLAKRYNNIVSEIELPLIQKIPNDELLIEMNTFVIELDGYFAQTAYFGEEIVKTEQGTGFFLKNVDFITNAHVISKYATAFDEASKIDPIKIHRSNYDSKERYASLVKHCIKKILLYVWLRPAKCTISDIFLSRKTLAFSGRRLLNFNYIPRELGKHNVTFNL